MITAFNLLVSRGLSSADGYPAPHVCAELNPSELPRYRAAVWLLSPGQVPDSPLL